MAAAVGPAGGSSAGYDGSRQSRMGQQDGAGQKGGGLAGCRGSAGGLFLVPCLEDSADAWSEQQCSESFEIHECNNIVCSPWQWLNMDPLVFPQNYNWYWTLVQPLALATQALLIYAQENYGALHFRRLNSSHCISIWCLVVWVKHILQIDKILGLTLITAHLGSTLVLFTRLKSPQLSQWSQPL